MTPQPWARTGPGTAKDGKPKFNLEAFDPAYFNRLRDYVVAAGNQGIYVAVMLFDGWALHLSPAPDNGEGHPFHALNNANGIGIRSIIDYQVLLLDPHVQALQEAYIRAVVDAVHDLPNVLYEVANESSGGGTVDQSFADALGLGPTPAWGDSTEWQYWVIDVVKRYEQQRGYDSHPIGMTMQFPVADQTKVNRSPDQQPGRLDLPRVRRRDIHRWPASDGARQSPFSLVRQPTRSRRQEGSGPAFEGAHVEDGMHAAPVAIERVQINSGQPHVKTIGDQPPVGICGSGIVDAISEMHRAGIIDRRGVLPRPRSGRGWKC